MKVGRAIVENCDIIVGNEEDLQMGLGLEGVDVEKASAPAFRARILPPPPPLPLCRWRVVE